MMESWQEYKFSDIAKFPPRIKMIKGENYPFIPMENLDGSTKFAKPLYERKLKGGGAKFEEGDTLFSRITPCLQNGKIAQVCDLNNKCGFGSTEFFVFRGLKSVSDSDFIYYLSKTYWFRQNAINSMVGASGRQRADAGFIRNLKINLPPLPTQRKIAAILSAYDDLIENNLKRIQLLEEKAQLTYEEWFVRMKFPGHETTPIDKETGLPEGWEKKTFDYLCDKITDGTHDSPKQVEEGIKLITGKHIARGFIDFESSYFISHEDHEKIKKRSEISKGDILFSNIGTLGNIGFVTENFEYSCKNLIIFKHKKNYNSFLYCYLSDKHTRMKLDARSSGVAQKFYSLKLIRNYKDYYPNEDLITHFDQVVKPIISLKFQLNRQKKLLKEARDILLPRLMTGMIDVDKL